MPKIISGVWARTRQKSFHQAWWIPTTTGLTDSPEQDRARRMHSKQNSALRTVGKVAKRRAEGTQRKWDSGPREQQDGMKKGRNR